MKFFSFAGQCCRAIHFYAFLMLINVAVLLADSAQADDPGGLQLVVTSEPGGRPLGGANIELRDRDTTDVRVAITDANGVLVVDNLATGLYELVATKNGYATVVEPSVRVSSSKTVRVPISMPIAVEQLAVIEEVLVRAKRADVFTSASGVYVDREALRSAVGGGSDPLRALDGLPGLASTGEFASYSVRGRGPRDNLVLVDDLPFNRIVHFDASLGEEEDIGGGGRFSIFAPNVVGGLEFSPGGWSAAYGGQAASLLKLDIAEGNPSPSASLRVDLTGFEVGYDGPSGLGDEGSILFSARDLDFGQFFETIDELDVGEPTVQDTLFKIVNPLGSANVLELLLIDSQEEFDRDITHVLESPNFEDVALLSTEQNSSLYGLTLRSFVGDQGVWTNRIYFTDEEKNGSEGEAFPDLVPQGTAIELIPIRENILSIKENQKELGFRSDFETSNALGELKLGVHIRDIDLDYSTNLNGDWVRYVYDSDDARDDPEQKFIELTAESINSSLDISETNISAYLEQSITRGDWDFRVGLRADSDGFTDEDLISPRLSLAWRPTEDLRIFSTLGEFYQSPRFLDLSSNSDVGLENEQIRHASLGVEYRPSQTSRLLLEAYSQDLDNLVEDGDRVSANLGNSGSGSNQGVDIVYDNELITGLNANISYSYNDAVLDGRDGGADRPTDFNRKHTASLGLQWEINDRWKIGFRYKYLSGRPDNEFIIHENVLGAGQPLRFSKELTELNSERRDGFGLLNVRFDYRRPFGPFDMTAFLDIINVTSADSSDTLEFDPRRGINITEEGESQPILGLRFDYAW